TLPSPLYGLYRARDGLSAFTITIVYALWAAGTIAALIAVPFIAGRIGRRGDDDGGRGRASGVEGAAGPAARTPAHRVRGRDGRRDRDRVPHRAAPPC